MTAATAFPSPDDAVYWQDAKKSRPFPVLGHDSFFVLTSGKLVRTNDRS